MYRSGVYYDEAEDEPTLQFYMNFIKNRGKPPAVSQAKLTMNDPNDNSKLSRVIYTECIPLQNFYTAEEMQQNYLRRNPQVKTRIDSQLLKNLGSIR